MKGNSISMWLLRFARQQPLYLMIAAGAAGIIWAVTGQAPSLTVTLIYSFVCGNFTMLVLENVHVPCSWRAASWSWLIYLILLLVTTPMAVTAATLVVFIFVPPALVPPAPRTSFGDFLLTAWKFPAVANLIFGAACLSYLMTGAAWKIGTVNYSGLSIRKRARGNTTPRISSKLVKYKRGCYPRSFHN